MQPIIQRDLYYMLYNKAVGMRWGNLKISANP